MYLKPKNTQVIRLKPEDEIKIEKIMIEDAKLLKSMFLMDYSLLLCIERVQQTDEKIQEAQKRADESMNTFLSIDKQELYHLGIIDYL